MGLFGTRRGSSPSFDTPLSPDEEAAFRTWAGERIGDTQDYDLRGAYLNKTLPSANGHLPDTFKKPNHPTFSDESQYSSPGAAGGRWVEDGRGGWVFWASPLNMQQSSMSGLAEYFKLNEPGNSAISPLNYRLPRR